MHSMSAVVHNLTYQQSENRSFQVKPCFFVDFCLKVVKLTNRLRAQGGNIFFFLKTTQTAVLKTVDFAKICGFRPNERPLTYPRKGNPYILIC